jgi:hypothetical protein
MKPATLRRHALRIEEQLHQAVDLIVETTMRKCDELIEVPFNPSVLARRVNDVHAWPTAGTGDVRSQVETHSSSFDPARLPNGRSAPAPARELPAP